MSKSKSKTKNAKIVKQVRFSLPLESESDDDKNSANRMKTKLNLKNNEHKVHGTARYINGTLDFCQNDISTSNRKIMSNSNNGLPILRIDRASAIVNPHSECRNTYKNVNNKDMFHSNCWTRSFHDYREPKIPYKNSNNDKNNKTKKHRIRSCTTILFSPTKCMRSSCLPKSNKSSHSETTNQLEVPPLYASYERLNYKLSELKVGGEKSFTTFLSSKLRNMNKNKK